MNDIEHIPGNDDRSDNWGFLEDMASIGRLDMVLGDAEAPAPTSEEALPEDPVQEEG
jgi:hypothetical protein